jgi:malonyl-CoA O-methyltransferase
MLDPRRIRRSFNDAASTYDAHAAIQREVADRLLERLDWMRLSPERILDVGAGTGYCARLLERRYRGSRVILLDLAPGMLLESRRRSGWFAREHYVCARAELLPLADASVDLIVSSLAFQWCEQLDVVFRECRRVLKPGGLLLFSSLGPDTLKELRSAFATFDASPHVNRFPDMHIVGDALVEAGFSSPVLEREDLVATYIDVLTLMRDLKGIGARNSDHDRHRHLSGRKLLQALELGYEPFRREGLLPATYELVFGHGWVSPQARRQDGSTVFPLNRITRR